MKIFGSDFDNTLLVDDKISVEDKTAIEAFRLKGNYFGIITGRTIGSIITELMIHDLECDFIVAGNGAFLADGKGSSYYSKYINKDVVYQIMEFLDQVQPNSYILHDGYNIARKVYSEDFKIGQSQKTHNLEDILENDVGGFFINVGSIEKAAELVNHMTHLFPNVEIHQNLSYVDITAAGVNKANGIQKLSNLIKSDDIWVIGDAENDMSMISSYNSFVVSWADDKLKKEADFIVDSVNEAIKVVDAYGTKSIDG